MTDRPWTKPAVRRDATSGEFCCWHCGHASSRHHTEYDAEHGADGGNFMNPCSDCACYDYQHYGRRP